MSCIKRMNGAEKEMTKEQLEDGRQEGHRYYGYFYSFCKLTRSCEECDKHIALGCKLKRYIEYLQTKRILKKGL